jgi:23S rRNA (adenine2503-C2)-methyltransferase
VTAPPTILDLPPGDASVLLKAWVAEHKLPPYRATQLLRRLWIAPVTSWQGATEVPKAIRAELERTFPIPRLREEVVQESQDGTKKFLWGLADDEKIESVLIPSAGRRTLCISSQAGCALGCVFCATGQMGFRRNLATWEIVAQVRELVLRDPGDKPTNVVFMGMGEPLLNWDAVNDALTILNHPDGFGIGARHITVSTVGIVPGMLALAKRPEQFRLAISLHSPHAADRLALMPIEKKYPLAEVIAAAATFQRRITFEYVLIAGKNDRERDAIGLASLARRLGAHVNILPLHPGGNPELVPTAPARIREFREALTARGIEAVVRRSRGLDIDAACGQLRVAVEKRRRGANSGASS